MSAPARDCADRDARRTMRRAPAGSFFGRRKGHKLRSTRPT
jgi:hypothetical protein